MIPPPLGMGVVPLKEGGVSNPGQSSRCRTRGKLLTYVHLTSVMLWDAVTRDQLDEIDSEASRGVESYSSKYRRSWANGR